VRTIDYAFSPGGINVPAGTTVRWENQGAVVHTATDTQLRWDTGDIASGQTGSVTFNTPGTYIYNCSPHPWMIGRVVVT
jgi:plastocyanin